MATQNPNKVREIRQIFEGRYAFESLLDIGCEEDVPETSDTIEGNALQKARYVAAKYNCDCFSEDTGLEIAALGGEPGVYTARYAGPAKDPEANMALALEKLKDKDNRAAQFKTVIALILDGKEYLFTGIAAGEIMEAKQGDGGFGYDPIFRLKGETRTFAEMSAEEKNVVSHRGKAVAQLKDFLLSQ